MKKPIFFFTTLVLFITIFSIPVFAQECAISGYVTRYGSQYLPFENVTMTASNGGGTTQTLADGSYIFLLPLGWSGTITPSITPSPSMGYYEFYPGNRSYFNLTSNLTDQLFQGTFKYVLSGYVRTLDGPYGNSPLNFTESIVGVTVYMGSPDMLFLCRFRHTDQNGFYCFQIAEDYNALPFENLGIMWVDLPDCISVPPSFVTVGVLLGDDWYNCNFNVFIGLDGYVKDNSWGNYPIKNVTMTVVSNDGKTAVDVTGDWGEFYFYLNYNFSGTITPSKSGWEFEPPYVSYSNLLTNQFNQFIGTPVDLVERIESLGLPSEFELGQNYPNPFNPSTTINYEIARPGQVVLNVYNMNGQEVAELVNEYQLPGNYRAIFKAQDDLPSGNYIYRLQAGDQVLKQKMLFLK